MTTPARTARKAKKITLDQDPLQSFLSVLYYGPNGTGKTTNLAYMAHLGEVAYIRADRSVRKRRLKQLGVPTDNIVPYDTLDTEYIVKTLIPEWRQRLADEPGSIVGICLDTATELIARRLEAIVDNEWAKTVAYARRNRSEPDKDKQYFADYNYYQPITQEMRRVIRQLIDLPCHVAVAAQTRRDIDDDDGTVRVGPAVNPAFSGDLMAYMDLVVRTEVVGIWPDTDNEIVLGHPRPTGKYVGKDRDHALPAVMVEPTFDRVLAYFKGDLTKDNDPRHKAYAELRAARKRARRGGAEEGG